MKTAFLLASLVAPTMADLLIPRNVYLNHTIFKSGTDGKQCDDCCDAGVKLDYDIKFFGKKHREFWPCANGLISFNAEVSDFTPEPFPIRGQPVVAAFWGDADLRTCKPERKSRCSYWAVYYNTPGNPDNPASLLDEEVTRKYMQEDQTFKAKVAIVQTWDNVGYYDLQTDKTNTFQIVIVSDGFENAFAGIYYGRLGWTTGDSSDGIDGLGGIQAQMGFDAGNDLNFFAHEYSQTASMILLENKEFIYAISNTLICPSGSELIGTTCTPLSCPLSQPFPIRDVTGKNKLRADGSLNDNYQNPDNVVLGDCANIFESDGKGGFKKVKHGKKCALKCQYKQDGPEDTWLTFQPKNYGTSAAQKVETENGVMAECKNAEWNDNAAQNCVEVGIQYEVLGSGELSVREPDTAATQAIQISLKSKPYGVVIVTMQTSCKGGTPSTAQTGGSYTCAGTGNNKPLASFRSSGGAFLYSQTVTFGSGHTPWNSPRRFEIKGTDNTEKSAIGYESFTVRLSVLQTQSESCDSVGCSVTKPYDSFKKTVTIPGKLLDDEGVELKATSLTTDESGAKAQFTVVSATSLTGKILSCKSSDPLEGKVTAYTVDGGQEIPIAANGTVTFGSGAYSFVVKGQPDNVVDGPKTFQVDCTATPPQGTILGVKFTNLDVNTPGVIVNTTMSEKFYQQGVDDGCPGTDNRPNKMPNGCGILQTREGKKCPVTEASCPLPTTGGDIFSVQLVTKPREGVVVVGVTPSDNGEVLVSPSSVQFNQQNWNKPQWFRVMGVPDDLLDGTVLSTVDISVDSESTTDNGYTRVNQGTKTIVLGYANCGGKRDGANTDKGRRLADSQTQADLDLERSDMTVNCFSYEIAKITGSKVGPQPDQARLSLDVETKNDTIDLTAAAAAITATIAGIIVVVVIVAIAIFVAGLFVILAVKKKRGEEAKRKENMKQEASQKENDIEFHLDDEGEFDMESTKGTQHKLKDERDRLREENVTLATQAGEPPLILADTEDPDCMVAQIKELKGENDRLREHAKTAKAGPQRKKKNKKTGFGQHKS